VKVPLDTLIVGYPIDDVICVGVTPLKMLTITPVMPILCVLAELYRELIDMSNRFSDPKYDIIVSSTAI
jgi:hypothetical protein